MLKITPITPENGKLEGFALFWSVYPRKVAKLEALRAWEATKKLRPPIEEIIAALRSQAEKCEDMRYFPHPASWLRSGRWLDE